MWLRKVAYEGWLYWNCCINVCCSLLILNVPSVSMWMPCFTIAYAICNGGCSLELPARINMGLCGNLRKVLSISWNIKDPIEIMANGLLGQVKQDSLDF